MNDIKRINYINEYLKEKFGERTLKIGIDAGFTCPNRDGKKGYGGCIFCSERGSGDHLSAACSIEQQIENYFRSYRANRANKFLLYFQNYSNTYGDVKALKEKYDTALYFAKKFISENDLKKEIVGLAIATRPDCISEDICKLLASYGDQYYISIELGLQTSNDNTGVTINRGYSSEDFTHAVHLLNQYHIDVVAHIIVGLPNENHSDIENTIAFLNHHTIQGIKIHSMYIVKNTALAKLYENKKYDPITLETYLNEVTYIITHANKELVIHRISGDAPKDLLVAPEWNLHKKLVMNGISNRFEKENLWQGMYTNKNQVV